MRVLLTEKTAEPAATAWLLSRVVVVVALLGGVVDVWRAANAAEGGGGVRQSRREVATAGLVPAGGVTERAAPVEEVPEDVSSSYTRQAASWMRCAITLKLFVLKA